MSNTNVVEIKECLLPEQQEFLDEYEALGQLEIATIALNECHDLEDAQRMMEQYQGEYESASDYAWHLVEDCGMLEGAPEVAKRYFDYDSFGCDMELGGDITIIEVGYKRCFIFNNH
jgi:antirestriction protein